MKTANSRRVSSADARTVVGRPARRRTDSLPAAKAELGGPSSFDVRLVRWYRANGRHDLPWQGTRDPYRIWLSEIMLQQTQVAAVIPYFHRFLERFPDLASVARSPLDEVMRLWSGLGYYSRARNLHHAAVQVAERHEGVFPSRFEDVLALPGIGRSTAAAICAFSSGGRHAILDGNVKRVLCRAFGVEGFPGNASVEKTLWTLAERLLPRKSVREYTQALMDLGALVCVRNRPRCDQCPVQVGCVARRMDRVDQLPAPRPARSRPLRRMTFLVLLRAGEVLLEKRPPTGIWGGLWSLPEVDVDANLAALLLERFGVVSGGMDTLPTIDHGFTHFQLVITPLRVRVAAVDSRVRSPGHIWLSVEDASGAAIPAPVRKLLTGLAARQRSTRKSRLASRATTMRPVQAASKRTVRA